MDNTQTPVNEEPQLPPDAPQVYPTPENNAEQHLPLSQTPQPKTKHGKKKLIILGFCLVAAAAAAYLLLKPATPANTSASLANKTSTTSAQTSTFNPVKLADGNIKVADRTWFATPISKPLASYTVFPMSVLRCDKDCTPAYDNYAFWQVGKTDDGKDIVLANSLTIDGGPFLFLSKAGKNTLLKKESPDIFNPDSGKLIYDGYGANTTQDNDTSYPELAAPQTLTLNGKKFSLQSKFGFPLLDSDSTKNLTAYASTNYGPVSSESRTTDQTSGTTYEAKRYVLQLYSFRPAYYQPDPVLDNVKEGTITYTDNTTNKSTYSNGFHGCSLGGSYYDVMLDKNASYTAAGTYGSSSVQLYTLSNQASAPIVKDTYDSYQSYAKDSGSDTFPSLTMSQFLQKNPVLFFQNSLGEYTALYNGDVIVGGGCGKPVIYLYPQKAQNVSVKVDADIRISEPNYNDGWQVYAKPSGQLTVNRKQYNSLYWEGLGKYYPDVTSGTIVAKAQLTSVLTQQLSELGLNSKESNDFLAFWLPKMPTTNYTRLTWFGTSQVNKIAPLSVTPAPDTVIRIFLDYEGLKAPMNLPSQKLNHLPRKGFTVVEWGGLLKTPLP
jgi:hypothetical protein